MKSGYRIDCSFIKKGLFGIMENPSIVGFAVLPRSRGEIFIPVDIGRVLASPTL